MAESIQPYTPARVDYLARYLQTQLPGLNYELAVKWINAEQGENGNVLGVTYDAAPGTTGYQGTLYRYPTQEEGIRQAAALVKRSGNYAGIRASLGQSYTAQAQALVASPWNVRNSRYYARLFGIAPLSGVVPTIGTGSATAAPATTTLDKLLGLPADYTIGPTDAQRKELDAKVDALLAAGKISADTAKGLHGTLVSAQVAATLGGRLIKLSDITVVSMTGAFPDPLQGIRDAVAVPADIAAFLFDPENWKYAGALIVGVPLALLGFYLLAGVPTAGQNA